MIIYRATNTVNGKVYIGKTVLRLKRRWDQHVAAATRSRTSQLKLSHAIRKYGAAAFLVEEIARVETGPELNELERRLIASHRSNERSVGYNMTSGGDGFTFGNALRSGRKLSDEHKAAISRANSHPKSEETRARMRAAQRLRGPHSEEAKAKMRGPRGGKGRRPSFGTKRKPNARQQSLFI